MGQVTLYLDSDTETKMKLAAREAGLSLSRWVANLIRQRTAEEWPTSIARLAGAWTDLPEADELRVSMGEDVPREPI